MKGYRIVNRKFSTTAWQGCVLIKPLSEAMLSSTLFGGPPHQFSRSILSGYAGKVN